MKIVVFLDAAHQRKYIEIVSSAMAESDGVLVEAVDISAGVVPSETKRLTLFSKLASFPPVRLGTMVLLAFFYAPYLGFKKFQRWSSALMHQHLRAFSLTNAGLSQPQKVRKQHNRFTHQTRAYVSGLRLWLRSKVASCPLVRLVTKVILAFFHAPYLGFKKFHRWSSALMHQHLRAFSLTNAGLSQPQKVRKQHNRLTHQTRAHVSGLRLWLRSDRHLFLLQRERAARRTTTLRRYAFVLRRRLRHSFQPLWRVWLRFGPNLVAKLYRGTVSWFRDWSFLYVITTDRHWQRCLNKCIFSLQPDLIVLLEDNAQGLTGLVSHAARKRRIPFVILPDYIPNPAEPARYYFNDAAHAADTSMGRMVRYLASRWVIEYSGKQLLRLPANAIFAQWLRGQHCPQPWILNAGYTEAVFLESKAALRHYEALDFKPEKLRVIGGAVEDVLHELSVQRSAQRQALFSHCALDPTLPLVVCGFPPDQFTAATEGFEFETYEQLCRNWFQSLEGMTDRTNVIIVRHPRTKAEILAPFAEGKVKIVDRSLETVLPLADIYVACISTTIRWALALGIPVINYDTYRYRYGDFSSALGCNEVTSADDFRTSLDNILTPGALAKLKCVAEGDRNEWGLMDGNFKKRLKDSLVEIHQQYRRRPQSTHVEGYRLGKRN